MQNMWYNTVNTNAPAQRQLPGAWPNLSERIDMATIPRFYVYILARPSGRPFYVGKGTRRRVFDHDAEARSGHQCHKCNVIRKIWKQGGEVQRYTVFTTDDQDEAYAYEAEMIALIGRKNLANGTDGGVGGRGRAFFDATRARMSAAARTSPSATKRREINRQARLADWSDPAYREKQIELARERWQDADYRARVTASSRATFARPDVQARRAEINKANRSTPKAREETSKRWKATWADPAYRARRTLECVCDQCGETFSAITVTARFCAERCKHRYYREHKP